MSGLDSEERNQVKKAVEDEGENSRGGVGGGKGQESIEEGSEMGWWICGVERSRT